MGMNREIPHNNEYELPETRLNDGLTEAKSEREPIDVLGKILEAIFRVETLFTFNEIETVKEFFPMIEEVVRRQTGEANLSPDERSILTEEKTRLINALPDKYNIREMVAEAVKLEGE